MPDPAPPRTSHTWRLLPLLALCLGVYWLNLGSRPFHSSEGHRVVPGWTMLESGNWWRVEMFGATYLRKPPGMPWAIGAGAAIFGQTEFGARSPSAFSATLMVFIAYAFAARWYGPRWGLAAGLAQALMPLMWSPGRSAEIEALLCLGAQLAALPVIELLLRPRAAPLGRREEGTLTLIGAIGLLIAVAAKGPAVVPVVIGAAIGAAWFSGRAAPPTRPGLPRRLAPVGVMLALAAAMLVPLASRVHRLNNDPNAIVEEFGQFLWKPSAILEWLAFAPLAFLSAAPISLTALFIFGRDARAEAADPRDPDAPRARAAALALAIAWLASIAALMLAGVHNPRYAMPAACFFPLIVPYVCRGLARDLPGMLPHRRRIARALTLGSPTTLACVLALAGIVSTQFDGFPANRSHNGSQRWTSGPGAGSRIAEATPNGAEVWADGLIEARPDSLLYARRTAADEFAKVILPRWTKGPIHHGELPPSGVVLALRDDERGRELPNYRAAIDSGALREIGRGSIGAYRFVLYLVE